MTTAKKDRLSVPAAMMPIYETLVRLTDEFCEQHLNGEYAGLCRQMAAALCRKRPSPLVQGTHKAWGCGIVYTVGRVNFLFDRSQTLHMSASELRSYFGVGQSTASEKAKRIQESLKIYGFDPRWTLASRLADNPRVWQIMINGLVVDARDATRNSRGSCATRVDSLPAWRTQRLSDEAVLFCWDQRPAASTIRV
jgi:hypothetical protein